MAIFEKRHSRGLRGTPAQKGVASKFGAATRGVSSDAEMAAKAPAGFNVLNNHSYKINSNQLLRQLNYLNKIA